MTTALANPNAVAWLYSADWGGNYRVRAKYSIVSQEADAEPKVGGVPADTTSDRPPRGLKLRYAIVKGNTSSKIRRVTVYQVGALLWGGLGETITLLIDGVDEVCTVIGGVGEIYHAGIVDPTHQA
jgi:hypothetical protein